MIIVDDHGAVGAEKLDAVRLALRRIVRRQRIADAEIDHRAVSECDQRPCHVMRAVAGVAIPDWPRATTSTGGLPSRNQHIRST